MDLRRETLVMYLSATGRRAELEEYLEETRRQYRQDLQLPDMDLATPGRYLRSLVFKRGPSDFVEIKELGYGFASKAYLVRKEAARWRSFHIVRINGG